MVHGRIWPNFKLIQALMYVIITCKYGKDPIQNNWEKVATPFFKLYHYLLPWKPVVRSGRISNSSKLLYISSLPASMKRIRWKIAEKMWWRHFLHYKSMGFFQTLKGSQLRSPWSYLAEFKTHSSSYVYHHYLQVWNLSNQKHSRKCDDNVFPTLTLSVATETSGHIWPNFKLIQALIHILITCKYEKDPIKNSGENVMTSFPPLCLWDFFHTLKGS